jgi:hypothetical protein
VFEPGAAGGATLREEAEIELRLRFASSSNFD